MLPERARFNIIDKTNSREVHVDVALAVNHLAGECKSDLEKYCASVPIGDGRVAGCLKQHEATLSAVCTQAMKDTQMQVK